MLCPWSFLFSFSVFQQIATQIAVLIAKVARLDCPRQWPELIPILLESVKGQDGLQQHRALLTFYHVTKTLASKRLAQDRRLFQDVSPQFYPFVSCFVITLSLRPLQFILCFNLIVTFGHSLSFHGFSSTALDAVAPHTCMKVTLGQQVKKNLKLELNCFCSLPPSFFLVFCPLSCFFFLLLPFFCKRFWMWINE